MKTRLYLIFTFLFFVSADLFAQLPWQRITPIPQEHTINGIQKIPGTNKLIAVAEGSTVMLSDNEGASWEIVLNPGGTPNDFFCLGTYFINETTGFLFGGKERILKTTDGGYTWEIKYAGNSNYESQCITDIYFTNEQNGFAIGASSTFLKTVDGGETWTTAISGFSFNPYCIEFENPATGYVLVGSDSVMVKTTDGGENWSLVPIFPGLPATSYSNLNFLTDSVAIIGCYESQATHPYKIYRTADAGLTWQLVFSSSSTYLLNFDFLDSMHGVGGSVSWNYSSVILLTNDGGLTWTEDWPSNMPWYSTNSLCYFDQDKIFSVGILGRIFRSDNAGLTWQQKNQFAFMGDIMSVQFPEPMVGYAVAKVYGGGMGYSEMKKTVDGGQSWESIYGASVDYSLISFIDINNGFYTFQSWGLNFSKTSDGGYHWTDYSTGYDFEPKAIRFFDENNGLIAGDWVMIRTADGGLTWQTVDDPGIWGYDISDIEYRSADKVFAVGNDWNSQGIIVSNDGGISWDRIDIENYQYGNDLHFASDSLAFIAGFNDIFKSTDGGYSWTKSNVSDAENMNFKALSFPSEYVGYAVGSGSSANTYKTVDGGENWEPINTSVSSDLSSVYFTDELHGLIFGDWGVESRTTTGGIVSINEEAEIDSESYFDVFPNPAFSDWMITFNNEVTGSNSSLIVTDLSGKQIEEYKIKKGVSELYFPENHLPSGIYCIQYLSGNHVRESRKLVIL
ncbi:MAG: T9SS type A sorting domain-containing protein [Bacteroidales bacterium]|nr:T9SS type A sorting domain-containing protein [Bacteroidales bacterium]